MEQAQRAPQTGQNADVRQFIVTLSVPDRDIVKVETLDKSGKRQTLPDEDFATLVGDEDIEDLLPVLEEAYVAGFSDANGESGGSAELSDEDDLEQAVARGVASRRLIRRSVRRLILGRLLKREMLRRHDEPNGPAGLSPETTH